MIDLHCHILPAVDDGPKNLEESLAMAKLAVADGVRCIVATPHTLNGVFENPKAKVEKDVSTLKGILQNHGIDLEIVPGSEVHINADLLGKIASGQVPTLNGTGKYVLLELPFSDIPSGTREELFRLIMAGIKPVLAHPERNTVLQRKFDLFDDFIGMGCLMQVTAMSITGELGARTMECAHRLLEHRMVHVIASDAHSADGRPPVLSGAVAAATQLTGEPETVEAMVTRWPEAILSGMPLDVPEPQKRVTKPWWRFW